jgi:TP901-1 family phage major tail protein
MSTGFSGRAFVFDWDSTTLVGVRTKGMNVANEYVDVTTDDDNGWRCLLEDPATRAVEMTVGGIVKDEVLLAAIMNASMTKDTLSAELPTSLATAGTMAGNFLVSSYESNGTHDGAVEFSATFLSTGAVTYTASSA